MSKQAQNIIIKQPNITPTRRSIIATQPDTTKRAITKPPLITHTQLMATPSTPIIMQPKRQSFT